MHEDQWLFPLSKQTPSLQWAQPLLDGVAAPGATLFVLSEEGGCAAVPTAHSVLSLGREKGRVNVVVGANDLRVSRHHATIRCDSQGTASWWTLRNESTLPIYLPKAPPLLQHQETPLGSGFTAVGIGSDPQHAVEVLVGSGPARPRRGFPEGTTRTERVELAPNERLVLVAMFQDYLRRSESAYPRSRKDISVILTQLTGDESWTQKRAEHTVNAVRKKLRARRSGLDSDSAHPERLRENLIDVLLETGSLVPGDLRLLGEQEP